MWVPCFDVYGGHGVVRTLGVRRLVRCGFLRVLVVRRQAYSFFELGGGVCLWVFLFGRYVCSLRSGSPLSETEADTSTMTVFMTAKVL